MVFDFEDYKEKVNAVPVLPFIDLGEEQDRLVVKVTVDQETQIYSGNNNSIFLKPKNALELGKFLVKTFSNLLDNNV